MKEGNILNNYFYERFVRQNKNVLIAMVGPTGSGKSWGCLSICEHWYQKYFHKPFPIENVCFSVEEIMQRVVEGNLKEGTFLILEEAGVSMSSLEFQNKISKLFNYILQSFRNRNIGVIVNLPYFSMLNKTTRMLMHMLIRTWEIRKSERRTYFRAYHLQWEQQSGKLYRHRPKIMIDGVYEKVDFIIYSAPSDELTEKYENKKQNFVVNISKEVLDKVRLATGNIQALMRNPIKLRGNLAKIKMCIENGITKTNDIVEFTKIQQPSVSRCKRILHEKGLIT